MLRSLGLVVAVCLLASCGFVGTGDSPGKPSGFPLRGYVSVRGASPGGIGTPCQAPPAAPDVVRGAPVQVLDPAGAKLGSSALGTGVLAEAPAGEYRCNFPFEVPNVPGGPDEYVVVVGTRPAVRFSAQELRANKPAIVVL